MKAQRRFGLALSWPRITAVFLIDVAVLAIASHLPDAWQAGHAAFWAGVAVAAVLTVAALVTFGGISFASAPVARVRNWYADPQALVAGCTPAIDHQRRFGRDVIGIREYEGQLVTVISVEAADGVSGKHRQRAGSPGALPVEAVAAALRQFDVRLDGVDIVSVGIRRGPKASRGVESAVQEDFGASGDGRPLDERRTWLVVRMDPQHNVAAVAARDSLASTLAGATERLTHDLDGRQCMARALTADEISDVDEAVLAGLDPNLIRPYWRFLKRPDGYVTSFWVSPSDITTETMEELWLPDTDVTVVTVRLTPRRNGIDVSAFVRYHSDKRVRKSVWGGLNRLTGRQLGAVRASLPAPWSGPELAVPSRALGHDEQLTVPINGSASAPEYSLGSAGAAR